MTAVLIGVAIVVICVIAVLFVGQDRNDRTPRP